MTATSEPTINAFILMFISLIISILVTGILLIASYAITKTRMRHYMPDLYIYEKDIKIV